jgi:ABC-type glutathione transport system ATPase component
MTETVPALEVDGLAVEYPGHGRRKPPVRVIDNVSFTLGKHQTLALVGESGSGKTTIGKAVLGLVPVAAGRIVLEGRDISQLSRHERRPLAASLQAIFQNPYGSLNPSLTIGRILSEPLFVDGDMTRQRALEAIEDLLSRVGMPADTIGRYPSNFSGGQRQRIAIARAIARNPRVVVCDEPTSALDVSTQASALALLAELQESLGVSYLFITHDLAVVREFARRVIVLENGRIVESGSALDVCDDPQHPYTRQLVAAAPVPDPRLQRERRAARLALATAGS